MKPLKKADGIKSKLTVCPEVDTEMEDFSELPPIDPLKKETNSRKSRHQRRVNREQI